jgi:hypothetical protein
MLSIGKCISIGAAVAAIATAAPVAVAGASTVPAAPAPVLPTNASTSGPYAGAFQAGADAAMAGWKAGADAAIGGWKAGADAAVGGWQAGADAWSAMFPLQSPALHFGAGAGLGAP